jgi:AraC-like DNA-binding protein
MASTSHISSFRESFFARMRDPWRLSALMDFLPEVSLYVKDRQSRFVLVNQRTAQRNGCRSPEELIGKTDFDFHPRQMAEQYVAEDERVMRGGVAIPHQVWLVGDHRGRLSWYISSKMPLFGSSADGNSADGGPGEVIGLAGVMRELAAADALIRPYQGMEDVLNHVLAHSHEEISIRELAGMVNLSISQFDRRFKQLFQMTPMQYVLRVRINAACHALSATGESIAHIAARTGFSDQSWFTKQFRQQTGLTPSAYRKQYREV